MKNYDSIVLVNAAIDEVSGVRDFYWVSNGGGNLPMWAEQLGSFRREHIVNHEAEAPDVSNHIMSCKVATMSFADLLDAHCVEALDLLQIDAEGMDGKLLSWFPFERIKPALLHYEVAHMRADERFATRALLEDLGYVIHNNECGTDDMAILL
jgi:hypothetical protein